MPGIAFYNHLRESLVPGEPINANGAYTFVGWSDDGKLIYNVNKSAKQPKRKRIAAELLVISKYWKIKNIVISYEWLLQNGHNNYCTAPALNYLLENH